MKTYPQRLSAMISALGQQKEPGGIYQDMDLASCVCPPGACALHGNKGPVLWDDFGSQPWLRATGFQALLDARMMSVSQREPTLRSSRSAGAPRQRQSRRFSPLQNRPESQS